MKIVHLSDLHLGFRQYQRTTAAGINQREADVASAFRKAIDRIIDIAPDVILIGGDVFHSVRPTNPALLQAFIQFSRLVQMLPDTAIVMVAGNHDIPRTSETGCILRLFKEIGISVVDDGEKNIAVPEHDLNVLVVPYNIRPWPELKPSPGARYNVLLMHDVVQGVINKYVFGDRMLDELPVKQLAASSWDYVALGHYHVYHQVAPNAYYSGSIEYTGSNVWGEVDIERQTGVPGKGFIEHNLETGEHKFHALPLARRVIDIPEIQGAGLTSQQLSERIANAVEACDGGIDDRVVRLVVRDVPRWILRDIDHRKIREYKRRALNFLLDARRPQPIRSESGSGAPGRRISLTETVRLMLESRAVSPGIERKSLVDLGLRYLDEAERLAPAMAGEDA
jgi:DNA repair exonuclease SbcCD nuclease subunit